MISNLVSDAKRAFITRNVDLSLAARFCGEAPAAGDLVVARVERIRQHARLEDVYGRRVWLYTGDRLILAAAPRYSTAQYRAELPTGLGDCQLVAAGGIAAGVSDRNAQVKPATDLFIEGILADIEGVPLNLKRFQRLPAAASIRGAALPAVMVLGSDMDAGKTTTACAAIRGLTNAGYRVQGAKLTGTGAGPDYWRMHDAGAVDVADFVDAGFASTVGTTPAQILEILSRIEQRALQHRADVMVVEIADGVLQPETSALIASPDFVSRFEGVLIAGDNASSAAYVAQRVAMAGLPVLAISGALTRSPVACREVVAATALPVFTPDQLQSSDVIQTVLAPLFRGGDVALGACE
ncbi:DUF1611 domain-containing protein [Marinobacterium zhoushanense]|uniref:DUF1611 domain-containing protein n=1 Tax=Marinobacterium zhoushanense TaxID=1679163 RepID=A0ABQ1KM72_9GAMM|nr:DUF1611 domain-containing protein [Marinobacterium zhoushanense]GGC04641.1 DUF1611 domain-containing protein [Marinobacterium zhoushanense]